MARQAQGRISVGKKIEEKIKLPELKQPTRDRNLNVVSVSQNRNSMSKASVIPTTNSQFLS